MTLTEARIREAKPQGKAFYVWDSTVKGFGLYVTKAGSKSFVLSYRSPDKVKHTVTLARVGELSLIEARQRATKEKLAIRDGESSGPLAKRQAIQEAPTFADLWQRFLDDVVPERLALGRFSKKSLSDYSKIARLYLLPVLGTLRVKDIVRADVERTARKAAKYPVQRNRMLAVASRLFSLAERWEWRGQNSNPAKGIERAKENARDRVLAGTELQALSVALDALERQYPYEVAAIRTAALTGLRISECLSLRWENVDLETGRAILPKTKTGRRVIPLAGPVRDTLAALPRLHGSPWAFNSSRDGVPATYRQTCRVFGLAGKRAGLGDVRLHDLRRSLATHLAARGVNAFVLRDVLGHADIAMSQRYVRVSSAALLEANETAAGFIQEAMKKKEGVLTE